MQRPLRLVTLNIWNRQGPWERRLPLLRAGLQALDADIIALQEVLRLPGSGDQATEIGTHPHVAYGAAIQIAGGPLEFGNALLSRWPIVETWVVPLPVERLDEGRSLLCARVDTPRGLLPVYVTHLTWQLHLGHDRVRQVRVIDDTIQETKVSDALPAVLLGDMNAEPDADEMRFLRGLTPLGGRSTYWADCFHLRGAGPGHTYARTNGYARVLCEPDRRLDYIFVRGPDRDKRGEPLAARVVLDEPSPSPSGQDWASDHYGVYAEVSW